MKKVLSLVMVFTVMLSLVACGISKEKLSPNGKQALTCVEKLISMTKAPDTFLLRDDVLVIQSETSYDHTPVVFTFIDYSAENSYGVAMRDVAAFCDGRYMASVDDLDKQKPDEDDYDDHSEYIDAMKKSSICLKMAMEYIAYQAMGDIGIDGTPEDEAHEKISKNDIAAILNIKIKE